MDFTLKGSFQENVDEWISLYCKILGLQVETFDEINRLKSVNFKHKEFPVALLRRYYINDDGGLSCWVIHTHCINGKLSTEYYVIKATREIEDIKDGIEIFKTISLSEYKKNPDMIFKKRRISDI